MLKESHNRWSHYRLFECIAFQNLPKGTKRRFVVKLLYYIQENNIKEIKY